MKLSNLDLVLRGLLGILPTHLERYLRASLGDRCTPETLRALLAGNGSAPDLPDLADLSTQIRILTARGSDRRYLLPLPPGLVSKLHEVRRFRNEAVHGQRFDADRTLAALVAVSETLRLIGSSRGQGEIRELIGAIDDAIDLPWMAKIAGQVLAAGVVVLNGVRMYWVSLPHQIIALDTPTSLLVTVLYIFVCVNAINLIDGLDGLASGVVGIGALALLLYTYLLAYQQQFAVATTASLVSATIAGICAGFLPHNFHRARMFMGDSGSMLLGLLLACSTISLTGQIDSSALTPSSGDILPALLPILLPIAVMAIPLADLTLAYVRRTWNGNWWFVADKKHLHHRLLQRGHSQVKAVLIMYMWTALVAFGVIVLGLVWNGWLVAALVVLVILAVLVTVGPLSARHRRAGRDAR